MTAVLTIWTAEFFLESAGAILNFKRNRLLSVILGIVALMDVVTFFFFRFWPEHYWQATWIRHAIRNLMFIWLGCEICGMFTEKRAQSIVTAAILSVGTAALVFSVGMSGDTVAHKLLEAEIVACFILLAYVVLAWIGSDMKLSSENRWKAAGFLVMIGTDLLFTLLWLKWDGARHWYWMGAIAAQLVWIVGPLRSVKLGEFRASLGRKYLGVENVRVM